MGIVQKISMIIMLILVGFSYGGAPLIGYYYGAADKDRLNELLGFVLRFLCGIALALSAVLMLAAQPAIWIFLKEEDLVQTGVLMLRTQTASMVFLAVVQFITIIFQATGKIILTLILSVSRQGIVFVIILFLAVRLCGYHGILLTQFFSDAITTVLALALYRCSSNIIKQGLPVNTGF